MNEIVNHYDNAKPGKIEAELQASAFDYIIDAGRRVQIARALKQKELRRTQIRIYATKDEHRQINALLKQLRSDPLAFIKE